MYMHQTVLYVALAVIFLPSPALFGSQLPRRFRELGCAWDLGLFIVID
jgi:hypothetical protein